MGAAHAGRPAHRGGTGIPAIRPLEIFRLSRPPTGQLHHVLADRFAGAIELFGSLLLLVGLYARQAAFIMAGEIAVAYFMRRAPNGFFPQVNGGGFEVMCCFVFLFLFFAGPGPWSIDAVRRHTVTI
jgi:uncharacterized membrane protein YphA (DoxX/SURF4 family)